MTEHNSQDLCGKPLHSSAVGERPVVYFVDDDVDVRKSLHYALSTAGITVWPFGAPEDFLDQLSELKPAPILLDIRMPNIDGIQLLRIIRDRGVHWPVIMMSAHGDIPIAVAAMRLGAVDFIEKPYDIDRLEALLISAYRELSQSSVAWQEREATDTRLASLTAREREVVDRVVQGLTNKQIAGELGISHRTVEIHRAAAMTKLGCGTTAEVIRLIVESGQSR